MCGIMGYIGKGDAVPVIIDGLSKLEYRGYDSAGIAVYNEGSLKVTKKKGRLAEMAAALGEVQPADLAIGHTRWATHGVPSDANAHPHCDCSGRIAVVHNGIIEIMRCWQGSDAGGHDFVSETDTEVLSHLVPGRWRKRHAGPRRILYGSYAIVGVPASPTG